MHTIPRDCGGRGSCLRTPNCARHLEQQTAELLRENAVLRSNSDTISSANAGLSRQVDEMALFIKQLTEELGHPENLQELLAEAKETERDLRKQLEEALHLAEERLAHVRQLSADLDAERVGLLALRKHYGARENETMFAFIERLAVSGQK